MNPRAALQNGARASAIKPNNKGHSKNSRAEAGKGTYTQFEPARTHTQLYNLNPSRCAVPQGDAAPAARGRRAGAAPSVLRDGRRAPDITPLMSALS